ncbi:MAG: formate dehydrogenase accessory sulfurtransferase FdhD [Methanomicrobiales archaeon]|nr:formate dehydrogenase accessory sulfurtransferase FdhD [Methanomicrobiales archaeon]
MSSHLEKAIQVRGQRGFLIDDTVVEEHSFPLYINEQLFGNLVASDDQLAELAAGFVITEGLADQVEQVRVIDGQLRITATAEVGRTRSIGTSGNVELSIEPRMVHADLKIPSSEVYRITKEIQSPLWEKTGGVHCSVLFCGRDLVVRSCDVGRHNTIDKVVGYAVLHGLDRSTCVIGCTGRQPAGMVAKVARAGIPIVISRAASTDRGIRTAAAYGVTLICFSRGDRYTIYTHPERIEGIEWEDSS